MELWVEDLSEGSKFSKPLCFVIDTGSQVTIVPRTLVPENAFPRHLALRPGTIIVRGAGGEHFPGLLFRASMSVPSPTPKYEVLSFQEMKIVVVDAWHDKYALLGLDAIRRVVLTADSDHVCLWPRRRRGRWKGKGKKQPGR